MALFQEIEGVRQARDREYLHRMRVATRRLRAVLPLFSSAVAPKKAEEWTLGIRKITRALGPARDLDVQIEQLEGYLNGLPTQRRTGIRRLLLRLTQSRLALQPSILIALDKLQSSGLIQKMEEKTGQILLSAPPETASPALFRLAKTSVLAKLDDMLAYEPYITQPEQIEQLHKMRIAAKWLRYTLETFAPLYPDNLKPYLRAAKDAQEMLGVIHDSDMWAAYLPAFLEAERQAVQEYYGHTRPFKRLEVGILAWGEDRRALREKTYQQFVSQWQEWQANTVWECLRQAVILLPSTSPNTSPDNPSPAA